MAYLDRESLPPSAGDEGSWDEAGVTNPVVRYYLGDNEQRWFMWYSGRTPNCADVDGLFPASGSIGVATSSDGVSWNRGADAIKGERGEGRAADNGRVMKPNEDWWWHDTCHMHVSDVQILSSASVGGGTGVYWCFYSGGNFEPVDVPDSLKPFLNTDTIEGLRLRPGLAMSQDGRNWARIEAEHHTGALFDVGADGEWDNLFIAAPQVIAAGPRDLRMYYYSFDPSVNRFRVGLATSEDGFKWIKKGPIFQGGSKEDDFDSMGVTNRCVIRDVDTKKYFMAYEGVAKDGKRSIGLAVSDDGLMKWERYPEPILTASEVGGAWDGDSVGCPWLVAMAQSRWRLYYTGRKEDGPWKGIGLAISEGDSETFKGGPTKFKRRQSS